MKVGSSLPNPFLKASHLATKPPVHESVGIFHSEVILEARKMTKARNSSTIRLARMALARMA